MTASSGLGLSQLLERQSARSTSLVEVHGYVRDICRHLPGNVSAARGLLASVPVWLSAGVVDALHVRGVELDTLLADTVEPAVAAGENGTIAPDGTVVPAGGGAVSVPVAGLDWSLFSW